MKVLVTGAAGMLGSTMCPILTEKGYGVIKTDIVDEKGITYLDVSNEAQVRKCVENTNPDVVMHLAAETDVDKCELNPDHAFLMNEIGTENMVLAGEDAKALVVYISTAGVFDGTKNEPYIEFDKPNPMNVYGQSKLNGERAVRRISKHFIVRAGWMVGGFERDKKFVYKIYKALQKPDPVKAVNDKFGSPTYTVDFSRNIAELIKTKRFGTYHMACKGVCTRYDIAKKIAEVCKSNTKILPVSSALFPLPAARVRSEAMRNYKLDLIKLNMMRNWENAIEDYIKNLIKLGV